MDTTCVLCKNDTETRSHLFFACSYSLQLWEHLVKGILGSAYTNDWSSIVRLITGSFSSKESFYVKYAFQAAVYAIWRERNRLKHGEKALPISILKKLTDKSIRNKFSLMRLSRRKNMEDIIQFWFHTRVLGL